MPPRTQSGHARLKQALILRDALAAELGLNLPQVLQPLSNVEGEMGAARALEEGRYLSTLDGLCQGDRDRLKALDTAVREACRQVKLAPRYAQYLAVLLFACWIDTRTEDTEPFLERLNHRLAKHPFDWGAAEAFSETDLQMAAFWMATAAGKTHVLHACLALLERRQRWDHIVLITPTEALTLQHAEKLRELHRWNVFAYPQDGDATRIGYLPADTVIVLDINKLAESKQGDGVTVATSVFEGRNLVFVDEGHKGQKSELSAWKKLQENLAGIGAPDPKHRGLLIEFSATFGQVAEMEHAFNRYAKTIVFDYAYDRFHADRYGKHFWHVKLDGKGDAGPAVQRQTLTAALLAFWHQVDCFRSGKSRAAAERHELQVQAPLWVLLGLSVIGGKNRQDQEQTSDVVDVLAYLQGILQSPDRLRDDLNEFLATKVSGTGLLPGEVREALSGKDPAVLARRILIDVFAWQPDDKPVFRLLKRAPGELGLGLLRADQVEYFGVVNVGDAGGLKKALEQVSLDVGEDALSESLFAGLSRNGSGINLLIGSRRFAEGWDNFRASSLTLLRLGQGEGALIVQMFGRVVRFAGRNGDGRRLADPPAELKPLQTAYIYGLQSKYLQTFLASLYENGTDFEQVECPIEVNLPMPSVLRAVGTEEPERAQFQVRAMGRDWLDAIGRKVSLSMIAGYTVATLERDGLAAERGEAGQDITGEFKRWLHILDEDRLYRDLVEFKRQKRWWNFAFDRLAIRAALESDRYELLGLPAILHIRTEFDWARLHRIAATLVRRLFESAYRRQQNRHHRYALLEVPESGIPERYYKVEYHG